MNESNNNFDELKRLLKLKRHEIPPPGYFNHFSGDVISRIRAGEAGGSKSLMERLQSQAPGLFNLLRVFETKPGMIGGFATSLCLLLLIGVVMADRPDTTPAEPATLAGSESTATSGFGSVAPVLAAADDTGIAMSTNPVVSLQATPALFGQSQNPLFHTASFMPSGQ
jgi:hypothetical protein